MYAFSFSKSSYCLVAKVGDRSGLSRGSLSLPRHLSQRRVRFPLRRYHTKTDAPQVKNQSFFCLQLSS
jgi:hypothetical protein